MVTTRPITSAERRRLEASAVELRRAIMAHPAGFPRCGLPFVRLSNVLRWLRTGQVPVR